MTSSHRTKAGSSRRYRQPSLWNTLMFRARLHPLFNPMSEFPMPTRRNALIRSVAAVAGDIAIGVAMASVCVWIIQVASLGLFLSFLLWLLGAMLSLALSQYVMHPALKLLLAENKLDRACAAVSDVARAIQRTAEDTAHTKPWADVLAAALQRKRA